MSRLWLGLASFLSLCPLVLQAQAVAVGVEAGVARTQLATPDDSWGSRLGWVVGTSVSLSQTRWLALRVGIRIHEKGAEVPASFEMRLRYLEFPLLAHFALGRATWPVRPLLTVGLAPARELSCAA